MKALLTIFTIVKNTKMASDFYNNHQKASSKMVEDPNWKIAKEFLIQDLAGGFIE